MPNTIYGEVDEDRVAQQEKELLEYCPRFAFAGSDLREIEEMTKQSQLGNAYMKNDSFFVGGDGTLIPLTEGRIAMGGQRQGYKIHVSAHPEHAATVAKAVLPLFREGGSLGGTYHKFQDLQSYTYGDIHNETVQMQRGKFITIYAKDEETLKDIASQVQNALTTSGITPEQGGGVSPGDAQLGTSGLMSMRYGQFMGSKKEQVYVNGRFIKDDRTRCCPEPLEGEFARVLEQTESHMESHKVGLHVPLVGPSNSNSTTTTSVDESSKKLSSPPPRPPRPELTRAETAQPTLKQEGRPLPPTPIRNDHQESLVSSSSKVRDALKSPQPRPPRRGLPQKNDSESLSESSSPLSTSQSQSQTTPSLPPRPPRPEPHGIETILSTSTSTSYTQPSPTSSKPPQYSPPPIPTTRTSSSDDGNSLSSPKSQEKVGVSLRLGGRSEKAKRNAMYGVDPTELKDLLKQQEEQALKTEKTVSKDNSVGRTWGGPRQPPPTGGSGGTGVRVGK